MKNRDWNTLIIFDAMRWEEGSKVLPEHFQGNAKKINTGCSTTFEWYKKYWSGSHKDTILVSENPQPWHKNSKNAAKNFFKAHMSFGDNWLQVNPLKTLELFFELKLEYPDKKFLVHLLPPHLPFFSGEGADLMCELDYKKVNIYKVVQEWGQKNGFNQLKKFYTEQIDEVSHLVASELHHFNLDEKLVISADHGELIGFDGHQYDHPPEPSDKQKKQLYEVPWFEVNIEETLVLKRMRHLGYMV